MEGGGVPGAQARGIVLCHQARLRAMYIVRTSALASLIMGRPVSVSPINTLSAAMNCIYRTQ